MEVRTVSENLTVEFYLSNISHHQLLWDTLFLKTGCGDTCPPSQLLGRLNQDCQIPSVQFEICEKHSC